MSFVAFPFACFHQDSYFEEKTAAENANEGKEGNAGDNAEPASKEDATVEPKK